MTSLSLLLIPALSWILYWTARLVQNYLAARRMSPGIPIIIIPIDHTTRLWCIIDRPCLSFLDQILPFGIIKRTRLWRYNIRGWELPDRYHTHHELGDVFAMVSPSRLWLFVGDPDAAAEILKRGNDFSRCVELTEVCNVFGPNLATVERPRWRVQRRVMASCLNELTNEIVWSETLSQGREMLQYWGTPGDDAGASAYSDSPAAVSTIANDLRTLSLHVLSRAGFGKSTKFRGHAAKMKQFEQMSADAKFDGGEGWYSEALNLVLENCILTMVLGRQFVSKRWIPRWLGGRRLDQIHQACVAFQRYMKGLYEEGKQTHSSCDHKAAGTHPAEGRFMASIVRASQSGASAGDEPPLTEAEVYGNIFLLNFSGHDTIASTMTFAIFFVAAHPEVQNWISEELRSVLGTRPEEWSYTADFPRLKRCMAVLLETLRLYNAVPLAKWTGDKTALLAVGERKIVVPSKTMVCPSYSSLHTDPRWWGADSLEWRPARWIEQGEGGEEVLKRHRRGAFIPWSEGGYDCPGKKFSQVECVAVLASLFRDWRADPACLPGEGLDEARQRVLRLIEEDTAPVLLLQMLHPERTPLVWTRR